MNDIKLSKLGNIDYIPKKRRLCDNCIFYEKCQYDYICPTLDRLIKLEMENEEL